MKRHEQVPTLLLNCTQKKTTHELWLVATASKERAAGKKGCLYLLIWIRWPEYVTVFTPPYGPRGAHTHKTATWKKTWLCALQLQRPLCYCSCFFFCAAYILCFFVSQISFIKLPAAPTLILAISTPPPKNDSFPSPLPPSNHPPYTCSDNHSSVSRLHPPLCPLHPSITHLALYL